MINRDFRNDVTHVTHVTTPHFTPVTKKLTGEKYLFFEGSLSMRKRCHHMK